MQRLDELQHMPYAAYRETPEWQRTARAARLRAKNRCQVCSVSVGLDVYHAHFESLGQEHEQDVLVLCATCAHQLAQACKDEPTLTLMQRALVFVPSALVGLVGPALLHAPAPAELFGLGAAIFLAVKSPAIYAELRGALPAGLVDALDRQAARRSARSERGEWTTWDRLIGRHLTAPAQSQEAVDEEESPERPAQSSALPEHPLFQAPQTVRSDALERVSVALICEHVERNSFQLYIGRSLTEPGHPAVPLAIDKQHIQIIGVSQHGKSSFAAALMEILTRTHDPEHLQLALLDMENLTSRLFADLPHVAEWNGTKLHARSIEEVIALLDLILEIIAYRYALPASERRDLPILLVYVEEFLALKNELKQRIALLKGEQFKEEREEAIRQYALLSTAVTTIALRGLKARVQLLLCAQIDYADTDFREAFAQFGLRLSFGVDPDAARAAGFKANELLAQNFKAHAVGQAVLEAPGVKDLLLAPDFPLEERLIALEARLSPPRRHLSAVQLALTTYRTAERKQARLERLRGASVAGSLALQQVHLVPRPKAGPRRATIEDAIAVWEESSEPIGRPRLRRELEARGLECTDDLAKSLLVQIKERLAGGAE